MSIQHKEFPEVTKLRRLQSKDLKNFQKQYPTIDSSDLQTWILGYQACIENIKKMFLGAKV